MNGPDAGGRKVQCRQIGRFTTTGNWFAQLLKSDDMEPKKDDWLAQLFEDGDSKKEEKDPNTSPNYKALTAGTPQLPECTGMNGDRKGPDTDCRQIGRYNGPWPVTEDVQI